MKARIIKNTPVFIRMPWGIEGSITKSNQFVYKNEMHVTVIGFGKTPVRVACLEVM